MDEAGEVVSRDSMRLGSEVGVIGPGSTESIELNGPSERLGLSAEPSSVGGELIGDPRSISLIAPPSISESSLMVSLAVMEGVLEGDLDGRTGSACSGECGVLIIVGNSVSEGRDETSGRGLSTLLLGVYLLFSQVFSRSEW
jgi:hypothetical protein